MTETQKRTILVRQCTGAEVVHVLARHGAHINAREKLKQCTPLHMAARRGNILVATALLDCGADLEAPDKLGETPLHRAVRCGKTEMVVFLLARGANGHVQGKLGLAPWQVARGAAMKHLLQPSHEQQTTGHSGNSRAFQKSSLPTNKARACSGQA